MQALILAKQAGEINQEQFVEAVKLIHKQTSTITKSINKMQHAANDNLGPVDTNSTDSQSQETASTSNNQGHGNSNNNNNNGQGNSNSNNGQGHGNGKNKKD